MSFTARELRAIQIYAVRRGYRVGLSVRPWVYFRVPNSTDDDCTERARISEIVDEYDRYLKEERRTKARDRATIPTQYPL